MRTIRGTAVLAAALMLSACSTTTAVPGPTVTVTASVPPATRTPESRIEALDAYALCAARIFSPPLNGRSRATITPFGGATIERTDEYGWYVLFEREDLSPDAAEHSGLGAEAWGRCALEGTVNDVTWFAAGYCSGPKPVDDLSDLSAIEPFVASEPRAPTCPTGS